MKKEHNPFSHPYHLWPPVVLESHKDKPLGPHGYIAPFTESYRAIWREWARKWKEKGVPLWPAMVKAYQDLDRQKLARTDY